MNSKFLGVFLNPIDVQSEGMDRVFQNLQAAGVNAIAFTPAVAEEADEKEGVRFPELHMDGYERVLARKLFGKQELYLQFYRSDPHDEALFRNTPYRPLPAAEKPDLDAALPHKIAAEARERGMEAHIQVTPFVPRGICKEDQPVLIDGTTPQPPQVSLNACLNRPAARAYALALVEDTMNHYRDVDGLFMDWVEHGAYRLEDHFGCFCASCEQEAKRLGFDWERMKRDVTKVWEMLHQLDSRHLEKAHRVLKTPSRLIEWFINHPGCMDLFRFKSAVVAGFYKQVRELLERMGLTHVKLNARGWPPPWNRSSGMDYRSLSDICDVVTPKLFTFDYSAMPRWYGQTLLSWNPGLTENEVLNLLVEAMQLPDDIKGRSFAHYHIPAPSELHPARLDCYRERIDEVTDQVNSCKCYPFAHAYLPEPQWKRMIALIRDSRADGMWVQMYGYLSDEKLKILKQVWHH